MAGKFCISIDLELGWGVRHRPSREYFQRCIHHEREVVRRLLAAFARYDVAVTWAIVGRLLVPGPAPVDAAGFGERLWYAPDVVDAIVAARPAHDIGSHGFEHLSATALDAAAFRADVEAARDVHRAQGLDFSSFVFPRNHIAHVGLLAALGPRVFRGEDQGWATEARRRLGTRAGRVANLLDKALPLPPVAVRTRRHGALVELPGSMQLLGRQGPRRLISSFSTLAKIEQGLSAARARCATFHLWFHPSNFYYAMEPQLELLTRVLAKVSELRARGALEVAPMRAYAA